MTKKPPYCPYCQAFLYLIEKYYWDCLLCDESFVLTPSYIRRITDAKIQETFENPFEKVKKTVLEDRQKTKQQKFALGPPDARRYPPLR